MTPHHRFLSRLARLEPLSFAARKTAAADLVTAFVADYGTGPSADEDAAAFLHALRDELSSNPEASRRPSVPAIAIAAVRKALSAIEKRSRNPDLVEALENA